MYWAKRKQYPTFVFIFVMLKNKLVEFVVLIPLGRFFETVIRLPERLIMKRDTSIFTFYLYSRNLSDRF